MSFIYYLGLFLFMGLSVLITLVVLVQESKSMGLGASFGGDAGESLFGTSTAEVLKTITAGLAVIFVLSCLILSLWSAKLGRSYSVSSPVVIEEAQVQ